MIDDAELRQLFRAHRKPVRLQSENDDLLSVNRTFDPYLQLHRRRSSAGLINLALLHETALLEACTRLRVCPECDLIFVARRRLRASAFLGAG